MSQIKLKDIFMLLIALVIGLSAGYLYDEAHRFKKIQPVQYPHKTHLDLGIKCMACHTGALENDHAGLPSTKLCANCHFQTDGKPNTPAVLAKHIKEGTEVPWQQVHRVPQHVKFSHRRHAGIGKLQCIQCHGAVASMKTPFEMPHFKTKMGQCLDCHRSKHVSTDCLACHK